MALSNKYLFEKYKLVSDTIKLYPNQFEQAWEEIKNINIPDDYKKIDNVVFCGMGGSALGARIVESFGFGKLRVPIKIVNDYKIPAYVNPKTLVIVSSYSGTTEETIESTYKAIKSNAKLFAITTGGKLSEIVKKEKIPAYVFNPLFNPSNQPRMSIGYAFGATLATFNKLNLLTISDDEIGNALRNSYKILTEIQENAPISKNLTHHFSLSLRNKIPIIVASEHLYGASYTIKNQFNESAKTFSVIFDIPELNHHLMEGLSNPKGQKELFEFIFFESENYDEKIRKRYKITADVLDKNNISYLFYNTKSKDLLSEIFEVLIFGSYTVYFLTKLYNIDPLEIPWVDYFKEKLSKYS